MLFFFNNYVTSWLRSCYQSFRWCTKSDWISDYWLLSTVFPVVKYQTSFFLRYLQRSSAFDGWILPERKLIFIRRFKSCLVVLWYYNLQMKYYVLTKAISSGWDHSGGSCRLILHHHCLHRSTINSCFSANYWGKASKAGESVSYYWKTGRKTQSKEGVDGIISDGLLGLCLGAADFWRLQPF